MPNPILMRKLRGGGGGTPFSPYILENWNYPYEVFQDYEPNPTDPPESPVVKLIHGVGWIKEGDVITNDSSFPVAEDMMGDTDSSGYTDGATIDGTGGGRGFGGNWEVG